METPEGSVGSNGLRSEIIDFPLSSDVEISLSKSRKIKANEEDISSSSSSCASTVSGPVNHDANSGDEYENEDEDKDDDKLGFIVKNYDGEIIKFYVPTSKVTLELLMKEISMGFNLKVGTFRIKYYDKFGDLASMRTDRSMRAALRVLKDITKTDQLQLIIVRVSS